MIAQQIRELRERLGLKRPAFAAAVTKAGAPVRVSTIEAWELETRTPRPEAMQALLSLGLRVPEGDGSTQAREITEAIKEAGK